MPSVELTKKQLCYPGKAWKNLQANPTTGFNNKEIYSETVLHKWIIKIVYKRLSRQPGASWSGSSLFAGLAGARFSCGSRSWVLVCSDNALLPFQYPETIPTWLQLAITMVVGPFALGRGKPGAEGNSLGIFRQFLCVEEKDMLGRPGSGGEAQSLVV